MKTRIGSISIILLLILGLALGGCSSKTDSESGGEKSQANSEATYVIKVGHTAKENEPYQIGLKAMDEKLQELTNGKAKLEIYPNSQLGSEREMTEAVQSGNLQMCETANGVLSTFDNSFGIFDLPYLFRDREHAYKVWDSSIGDDIAKNLPGKNMRVLAYYEAGVRNLMTKKPVNSMADLKGMKIRTLENAMHIDAWKTFGANPTPMAYNELYTGLEQGVVAGAEAANTNYYMQKFYEVSDNWAQIKWMVFVSEIIVNEEWFNSLPENIQSALVEAAIYSEGKEREAYAKTDNECLEKLKAEGVNVTSPDLTPFRQAAQTVWKKWADKVGGMELIQKIQDTQ